MKKRITAAIMCVTMIFAMTYVSLPATAASAGGGYQIQWTNTQSIILSMSYSNGKVNWTGQITGKADTTKIVATYKLEKKDASGKWVPVDSWSGLSTTSTVLLSTGSSTTEKGTYKLTVTGTVTSKGGYAEPISDSHEKTFT